MSPPRRVCRLAAVVWGLTFAGAACAGECELPGAYTREFRGRSIVLELRADGQLEERTGIPPRRGTWRPLGDGLIEAETQALEKHPVRRYYLLDCARRRYRWDASLERLRAQP